MIEIVKFEKFKQEITIGFRENKSIVYATVSGELTDSEAKQKGYELVYKALQYESTQTTPSIDGSEMKAIEEFTPKSPKVATLQIKGSDYIVFDDETTNKSIEYVVIAVDQYGNVFSKTNNTEIIENKTYTHVFTKTIDSITAIFKVNVIGYVEPVPSETELLRQDVEALADTTAVILEDTTIVAETTSSLVEDSTATAETLAMALLEIENLKTEVAALKGA